MVDPCMGIRSSSRVLATCRAVWWMAATPVRLSSPALASFPAFDDFRMIWRRRCSTEQAISRRNSACETSSSWDKDYANVSCSMNVAASKVAQQKNLIRTRSTEIYMEPKQTLWERLAAKFGRPKLLPWTSWLFLMPPLGNTITGTQMARADLLFWTHLPPGPVS